jgi:hypothetical protein
MQISLVCTPAFYVQILDIFFLCERSMTLFHEHLVGLNRKKETKKQKNK